MSKQSDTHHKLDKVDATRQSQQAITPKVPSGEFAITDSMPTNSIMGSAGQLTIQSQATYLSNNQSSIVQQQAVANHVLPTPKGISI